MEGPKNAIYIVLGEINLLLANLKRNFRYGSSSQYEQASQDPLFRNFYELKTILNDHSDLGEIDPSTFLAPFLEVIKSEETTGPVTGMALVSVQKFISYGLISLHSETSAACVQQIADSITHARFVGTDTSSDEVVLMKILQVLRTLMLSPIGYHLTNSSVCEIMQSCFQICFESRLSELLRRVAEGILVDMVQLLFARLPQFKEEAYKYSSVKKLTMKSGTDSASTAKKKVKKPKASPAKTPPTPTTTTVAASAPLPTASDQQRAVTPTSDTPAAVSQEATTTSEDTTPGGEGNGTGVVDEPQKLNLIASVSDSSASLANVAVAKENEDSVSVASAASTATTLSPDSPDSEYVNPRGVRFVQETASINSGGAASGSGAVPPGVVMSVPFGLPCVRELLRFLVSLISSKNTDVMISMGLNLLTIALESGVDHIASYPSLLALVKDDLSRNLATLLATERLGIYASTLRVSFLLFESLRGHLKLQIEFFFAKIMEIVASESSRQVPAEQREMTIDYLLQMLRIPGFAIEIYLNYDCSLTCSNLFEDLTKLLSKTAFSLQSLLVANSLSLSALLTIVDNIELENSASLRPSTSQERLLLSGAVRAPASSGFGSATAQFGGGKTTPLMATQVSTATSGSVRVNRMHVLSEQLPTQEELRLVRQKKRLLTQGVDLFNSSPAKGIQFLRDHRLLSSDAAVFMPQLTKFLRETPTLDKKMLGEYLSNRKNLGVLEEFIRSFHFTAMRIDEALRIMLETFRLPGEAPLISTIMENFAAHWCACNPNAFANNDAAYTLAYAIIMLNVDQHNRNVKKQSVPMTVDEFKRNVSKCNGGGDFDADVLEEIYVAIKSEEIIMPAEHTGALRDAYLWKVLVRRAKTNEDVYVHAPAGSYNQDIFNIVWGQTISALSFVYDRSIELSVIQKAINGFKKCAQLAAHYMMSDVFDNIVISLCKFSALQNQQVDSVDQLAVNFGMNNKAQLACRTVFQLTHSHGDILRDGWRNILDAIIQLYKAKLLPKVLVECEDFLHPDGRIKLIKDEPLIAKASEGGGLFSIFSWSNDVSSSKGPTPEEQEATKNAQACIDECHIGQLIHDTKFLRVDSLVELVKALIFASHLHTDADSASLAAAGSSALGGSSTNLSMSSGIGGGSGTNLSAAAGSSGLVSSTTSLGGANSGSASPGGPNGGDVNRNTDVDSAVFSLEILIKVVLQNRDRISCIWSMVRNHFCNIIINANEYSFFFERAVVGLVRISARLLRREELAAEVLSSLRMLLMIKKRSIAQRVCRQVVYGLHDLLRTNAANIHSNDDWANIFTILQVFGAGANITPTTPHMSSSKSIQAFKVSTGDMKALSDEESNNLTMDTTITTTSGYNSDPELKRQQSGGGARPTSPTDATSDISEYERELLRTGTQLASANMANQYRIDLDDISLGPHDKKAFAKSCETLTFLIRDMAHVTLQNFESCIQCLRTFVEACVLGDRSKELKKKEQAAPAKSSRFTKQSSTVKKPAAAARSNSPRSDESDEDDQFITSYETISIQLLDLLDTLHIKAASIFTIWADEQRRISEQPALIDSMVSNIWSKCWCPILQGIARLGCDSNGEVRMHALQYLQRALLVHELQTLSALEWEACFNKVLFPLLAKLLENIDPRNPHRMEETRMRASSLLCKVFLQHLTTLARLSTFTALWLTILDYMDKYMKSDKSDLLHDVIPESLKNMLLVMETTGLFNPNNQDIKFSQLRLITKDRTESFLPGYWDTLFHASMANNRSSNSQAAASVTDTTVRSQPQTAAINGSDLTSDVGHDRAASPPIQQQQAVPQAPQPSLVNSASNENLTTENEVQSPTKKQNNDIKDL